MKMSTYKLLATLKLGTDFPYICVVGFLYLEIMISVNMDELLKIFNNNRILDVGYYSVDFIGVIKMKV